MLGSVVTFYSYKGGVGRSFALANVAVILSQWGSRVLVIDFDIEAPGLNHYFANQVPNSPAGLLDFIQDCKRDAPRAWDAYTQPVVLPGVEHRLFLMPAAATGLPDYSELIQNLDWHELYGRHRFSERLESLRAAWLEHFDIVLVDSRTGLTDFSGITTAQLPDVLAFLFTANQQSLHGCCDIVRRAMDTRLRLPLGRPALLPLPIPAKFEQREEYDRAQSWRAQFARELAPFLDTWASRSTDYLRLVDMLTVPYVPRWTFGEDLAVMDELASPGGTRSASFPASYALETIAAVLANGFDKIDLLCSNRDEYVLTARAAVADHRERKTKGLQGPPRVFISATIADISVARRMSDIMRKRGFDSVFHESIISDNFVLEKLRAEHEKANAIIILIGRRASNFQDMEIEHFLRQSLRTEIRKPIIPVVLPGSTNTFMQSRLADFSSIDINPAHPLEKQLEPLFRRLGATQAREPRRSPERNE
jgi:cellulose biosynthesis protein BcsQ